MRKSPVTIKVLLSFFLPISLFITSVTAQTSHFRITLDRDGKQLQMPYYSNFPLDIPNTDIERAVIVHHGASRNPFDYFSYVVNSARTVGCEGSTIILAPLILTESDLATYKLEDDPMLAFFPGGWRDGDNSLSTDTHPRAITASNFEFYDEMLTQLANRDIYPNLKKIVFTGHSTGGQVTNCYAAGAKIPDTVLRPTGIHIRFVVANPSTFVYFTPERRIAGTLDQFAPPTAEELEEALDYNHYKYGLEGLNEYMSAVGPEQIRLQYQRREVFYLLGDQDRLSNNLDTSDGAMLQGRNRYERGQIYHNYVQHVFGSGTGRLHKKAIVKGVGHSGNAMYNSYQGRKVLFDYDPKPELIEPIDGALVIGGGGGMPQPVWDRFMKLAGGNDARLVVIPTASSDAGDLDPERYLTSWRARNPSSVVILHTQSQEVANDPAFVAPLKQATGVWFGGGSQSRIADSYVGTLVEKELYGVLERGGVIGGSSAGAAIQCRTMIRGGDDVPRMMRGLDFLPGSIIDQHFLARGRQKRLIRAVKDHPGMVGFGIDEKTALIVTQGSHIDIVGESCVMVYAAGRNAYATDRTAHSSFTHVELPDYDSGPTFQEKILLEGMTRAYTDEKISDLVTLYQSWSRAPAIGKVTGLKSHGYNQAEGAFEFTKERDEMSFTLEASEKSPIHNPGIVIADWPGRDTKAQVKVSGAKVSDIQQGIILNTEGAYSLVLWIETTSDQTVTVNISR